MKKNLRKKFFVLGTAMTICMATVACGSKKSETTTESNYVVNSSFEKDDVSMWTINNVDGVTQELNIYERATDAVTGDKTLHFYSENNVEFTAEQVITGLESGEYTLSCNIQGDGALDSEIYLYANVDGEIYTIDTSLSGYLTWNTPTIDSINVTGDSVTIGISVKNGPGGWGTIDDFSLTKK